MAPAYAGAFLLVAAMKWLISATADASSSETSEFPLATKDARLILGLFILTPAHHRFSGAFASYPQMRKIYLTLVK
ncbi:MAG: hypothetical protein KIT80_08395 [Chitinophagaceae bacterium]|nr:hypothetical protein [Chitinophagaceae bacterium]